MNGKKPVWIDYTNWRGERSHRLILPTGRILWNDGSNQWHKTPGWLLEAGDPTDGVTKQFSMDTIHKWGSQVAFDSQEYAELLAKCEAFCKEEDLRIEEIKKFLEGSQWPPTKE